MVCHAMIRLSLQPPQGPPDYLRDYDVTTNYLSYYRAPACHTTPGSAVLSTSAFIVKK